MTNQQKIDEVQEQVNCIKRAWISRRGDRAISPCDLILAARDEQIGTLLTTLDERDREIEHLEWIVEQVAARGEWYGPTLEVSFPDDARDEMRRLADILKNHPTLKEPT